MDSLEKQRSRGTSKSASPRDHDFGVSEWKSEIAAAYVARFRECISGTTIAEFSRKSGIADSTLRGYLDGSTMPSWETAVRIARVAGQQLDWFATLPEEVHIVGIASEPEAIYDVAAFVMVPLYDVRASAGHGAWNDTERVKKMLAFRRDWISTELGCQPDNLTLIYVDGDSMEPRFAAGDVVMVDRSVSEVRVDGVYVFLLDDQLLIKHLQRLPGGRLRAISENKTYEPFDLAAGSLGLEGEAQSYVIGRVVWGGVRV